MCEDSIPMLDVAAENEPLLDRLIAKASEVIRSGQYILGPEVDAFEHEVAEHIGVAHAVGVSSGTDALLVSLMALGIGPGDEVITTPFSFFATAGCIARVGATPVFVDIRPDTFNIDVEQVRAAITPRTRALLPVHLFGQPCDMQTLSQIATKHDLAIIEDAAQAIGADSPMGPVGSLGSFGCFSFFPSKNLGAFGDAGLVTTRHAASAEDARVLRAHGGKPKYFHAVVGGNFRIDALQAALLRVKLPELRTWTDLRRENAARYDAAFASAGLDETLLSPPFRRFEGHVYNQYVIRTSRRDALQAHLEASGIGTAIYYPVPLHRQRCFEHLGYAEGSLPVSERASRESLALPIFPGLGKTRQDRVIRTIIQFLRGTR
ncbi:MAG TPA: DegT/DnrJ/EryC1/StrS family aminotransferase [Polyangiales bacterium]|nr:DegT/DnrJ/EryC1/StrS family aminotransferase [Polyangiales bacterium]